MKRRVQVSKSRPGLGWLAVLGLGVLAALGACLNPRPEELPSGTTAVLPGDEDLGSPNTPDSPVEPPFGNDGNLGGLDGERDPGRPAPGGGVGGGVGADAGAPPADGGAQALDSTTGAAPAESEAGEDEPE